MQIDLPDNLPFPAARTKEEAEFWARCRARQLVFLTCASCGHVQHPPLPVCPLCQSFDNEWQAAPTEAELFTYTVVHHVVHEGVKDCVPYIVAVVLFPGLNSLRFVSNLVGVKKSEIIIGMPLKLIWQLQDNGVYLPRYTKADNK